MKNTKYFQKFDKEQILLHRLLLSSSMLHDIGLLKGKAGVMFFFMHYYRQTGNTLYEFDGYELPEMFFQQIERLIFFTDLEVDSK